MLCKESCIEKNKKHLKTTKMHCKMLYRPHIYGGLYYEIVDLDYLLLTIIIYK